MITKSGKAVETAGDIDVLLWIKQEPSPLGNRKATKFYPVNGVDEIHFIKSVALSSLPMKRPKENRSSN